ncbi:MAG: hypothetical protein OK474_04885, partial [Thaumarchaeota archaeon]|nr:hypothetical protein [Nitrososphaerota archaeon]
DDVVDDVELDDVVDDVELDDVVDDVELDDVVDDVELDDVVDDAGCSASVITPKALLRWTPNASVAEERALEVTSYCAYMS